MKAVRLRTDELENPIGLGNQTPCFFWNEEGGLKQTAYQIICKRDHQVIWDSGKVQSSSMTYIAYQGQPLHSRDQVQWSVTVWDEHDQSGEPSSALFEMGLLEKTDWKASWIAGNYRPVKNRSYPADCFEKISDEEKSITKARLYASARGIYNVSINGHLIDSQVLTPGMTDYRKRIQYQTYDVTELIREHNTIELQLADGWYRGSCAAYGVQDVYGIQTSVIAQLEITHADGSVSVIGTDDTWKWSNDGPVRFGDLKDGEVIDARMLPSYHENAVVVKAPSAPLVSSDNVPVSMRECFVPQLLKSKTGKMVLDFGQNLAGWIAFDEDAHEGMKIEMTMGETLDENGEVDLHGIQETRPANGWSQLLLIKKLLGKEIGKDTVLTPQQKIVYTCREGENHYRTQFAVFGFRYAEIKTDMDIDPAAFRSIAVYSAMEETGDYTCSNELVNQFVKNTRWSMKSNFLDLPTDCPTRERLGWTGDAQIFFNTGAYFMNTAPFFRKWLVDMQDAQYKNGLLPAVLPYEGAEIMYKSTGSSVGWADAVYLIPWRYYLMYGDKSVLENNWSMIRRYSDYLLKHTGLSDRKAAKQNPYNKYTYEKGIHLGEWLEPEEFRDKVYGASAKHPEECTAYFHYSMKIIGTIADLLGETEYRAKLKEYEDGSKKAYDWLIVQNGLLDTDRQAKLVRPLALGLLDGEVKKQTQNRLKQAVEHYRYRVGTGFLSTPFILGVLCDAGYSHTAYQMLENEEKPGWLSEVKSGATTVWENWEGNLSRNHDSPGSVCEWLFSRSAGIQVKGENQFEICPVFDESMDEISAFYCSIYGKITSTWKRNKESYVLEVTVPSNTSAFIVLPDGRRETVSAGHYQYEVNR